MAARISARLTPAQQGRRFGFTVGIAFLVLAAVVLWRGVDWLAMIFGTLGGLLLLGGLLVPARLGPVERAWMGFAHLLAKFTTPIFMGVVYFLVITPVGLIRRALGKNGLVHTMDSGSYLIARAAGDRASDLERQF